MSTLFAEVAIILPVINTYHYRVPSQLRHEVAVGRQVVVPFGRRKLTGYVLSLDTTLSAEVEEAAVRDLLQVSSEESYFSEADLPFYRWLSNYYLAPLGEVIQSVLPGGTSSSTRRVASVSEAGARCLLESQFHEEEAAVLSVLTEHPRLTLVQIRRHLPQYDVAKICRRLGRRGFIVWEDHVLEPRIRPRYLKVVSSLKAANLEEHIQPKEREILTLLEEAGPCLLKDLRRRVDNGYYWIRKLADRGLISVQSQEVYRDPVEDNSCEPSPEPKYTVYQKEAIETISKALEQKRFTSFLLHGVTGSGKTEVYMAAAAEAMRMGRQSLVLVPEIALTTQIEGLFRQRFQSRVAILHSGLGSGERRDEWVRVRRGEVDVVVGARSALFAPLDRLGLVVVDEEHDGSYKQERGLRYHGRDAAVMRAKFEDGVVVMGSATPALSSYHNALQGKFRLLNLPHRIDRRPLPSVSIVDMRHQRRGDLLSYPLRQDLADTLSQGKQALLLINRRGYANFLLCRNCGHVIHCRNCAVSLNWHRTGEKLRCHLCGLAVAVPPLCPQCDGNTLKPFGFGTQRVEAEVRRLLPEARVNRMDRDTTRSKRAHKRLLNDVRHGRTHILVGTQMIAKGHDLPNITLVGVVSADVALQWPDFRAAENTFQILTQVAGRAGRGNSPGRVIVQTYNPEHYSIRFAKEHDYEGFFKEEMNFRQDLGYPPYRRLVLFQLAGNVEKKTKHAAERLADKCRELMYEGKDQFAELEVLGPITAPLAKIKGKYRWQLLLKSGKVAPLLEAGRQLVNWWQFELRSSGVSLSADVDPMSLI